MNNMTAGLISGMAAAVTTLTMTCTTPDTQPEMAEQVAVSTTFPPVVPIEPTESIAPTPVTCDTQQATVDRLRARVARLKANQ